MRVRLHQAASLGSVFLAGGACLALWLGALELAGTLVIVLVLVGVMAVLRTSRAVNDQSSRLNDLRRKLSRVQDRLGGLREKQSVLTARLRESDRGLRVVSAEVEKVSATVLQEALRRDADHLAALDALKALGAREESLSVALASLREALDADRRRLTEMDASARRRAQSHADKVIRSLKEETRQVEALLQVLPRIEPGALLPGSGLWAMNARGLAHLLDIVTKERPKVIVELGSGTSTVWLAYACRRTGARVVSLDHDPEYAAKTRTELARHGLTDVAEVRVAPLEPVVIDGREFNWYSTAALQDLRSVDLVLVDGPPKATGENARWPALPLLHERLSSQALVLLDDAVRHEETETLRQWMADFEEFVEVDAGVSELGVLRRQRVRRPSES